MRDPVLDLGAMPLANDFLRPDQLLEPEPHYPLRAMVCRGCYLVQLDSCVDPHRIFSDYAYFSSYSETYRAHVNAYVDMITHRGSLPPTPLVVEIASNDGYLLQRLAAHGANVLGVEPAANIAAEANCSGVPTLNRFFSADAARDIAAARGRAQLVVANNVLAHVPDPHDFIAGLGLLLAPDGLATIEVHDVLRLIRGCQFDHIYHEHFQYFSLTSAHAAITRHALEVIDVEEIPSEGGSLRLYVRHAGAGLPGPRVAQRIAAEQRAGVATLAFYAGFGAAARLAIGQFRGFLARAAGDGRQVVAYGAAAKGNTLLNACGVGPDLVRYVVDRNPHKQGLFLPGTRLPIYAPERVFESRPDYLVILPWNLSAEIARQMRDIDVWGGRFVVPLPFPQVVDP